jgi:hypothetical protein
VLFRFLKGRKLGTGILPAMPAELIQTVASFLPMPALGNLRLACKELEAKILWYFATTYFREMKFMHSEYALEALVAISKSRMAQYVQTLGLGPPSNDQSVVVFNDEAPKSTIVRQEITTALYRYADENRTMRAFGHDAAMIQTALENLPAVTKIHLIAPHTDCDCGCIHAIPYSENPVPSYGERYLFQSLGSGKAGFAPIMLDSSQSLARLLHIALSSAQAANLQLENVEACPTTCPPEYMNECRMTGFAAYPLTFPSVPAGGLTDAAFAKLSTVRLFLGHHHDTCNTERRNQLVRRLLEFFARATALRTLGLTLQEGHGKVDCLKQLTQSSELSKIKRLELSNFDCVYTELCEILKPLKRTLEALRLQYVSVDAQDDLAMLKFFRDQMTSLNEVVLQYVLRYLHTLRYVVSCHEVRCQDMFS